MTIKILTWILLNYGLMNIIVYGAIFEPFREFFKEISQSKSKFRWVGKFMSKMTSCPMCFATWGGFFTAIVIWSPIHILFEIPIEISWFFDGIMASGAVWIINSIVEFFEENRINIKNNESV